MARVLLFLLIAMALFAAPSYASRAYGVLAPDRDALLTFEVDGHALRAAALRTRLYCEDGGWIDFAAKFAIAARGRQVLIAQRSRPDELRYRVHVRWPDFVITGRLIVTGLGDRKPTVHLGLHADACDARLHRQARREPGVLFTGATDDDEPVWARRLADGVEWVSGFGTGCRPSGWVEGLHNQVAPLTGTDAFGWPRLVDGFSYGTYDDLFALRVQLSGAFSGTSADGTLRIVARAGDAQADRCDTGRRTWHAVSG